VWGLQLFPGGRSAYVQVKPNQISTVDEAVKKVRHGQFCVIDPKNLKKMAKKYMEGG